MSKNKDIHVLAIGEDAIKVYDNLLRELALGTPEHERFKPESNATLLNSWLGALNRNKNNASQPVEESKND